MSFSQGAYNRARRRAAGVGTHARRDPNLDIDSLRRHAGFKTVNELGLALSVTGSPLMKAARDGLTIWGADKYASRLGYHPSEVWADRWVEANARHDQAVDQ